MITEESNREFAAQCRGCARREITRKPEANNTEQFWSQLRRSGWARTNYTFRDLGDTYWLWCPDCWQRVRRLPNYDNDTHRVLTKGTAMTEHRFTIEDVLDFLTAPDGDWDDDLDAWVNVAVDGATAVMTFSPTYGDDHKTTDADLRERFRVTVERVEES